MKYRAAFRRLLLIGTVACGDSLCGVANGGGLAGAQVAVRACGSSQRYNRLQADATFRARMLVLDQAGAEEYALWSTNKGARKVETATIPVVVHVLYNDKTVGSPDTNISDGQVQSQIAVLNRDYSPPESDREGDGVPTRFRDRFGLPNIRFVLAASDPGGATTDGIVRRQTNVTTFDTSDSAKRSDSNSGGDPPWPRDRYLNIWVVPGLKDTDGTPLVGYSSWPSEAPEVDGVVVWYQAFGTNGTAKPPFDGGRTATHEIGHWLNLHHLWGDRDNNDDCQDDDFVKDTPRQSGKHTDCPKLDKKVVSCDNNADGGDMFVNYMDYPPDSCMSMFSIGQVARMRATLTKMRSGFLHVDRPNP